MTSSTTTTRSTSTSDASSMVTIIPDTDSIPVTTTPQDRHFCIVLTNDPQMIQSVQQILQNPTVKNFVEVNKMIHMK